MLAGTEVLGENLPTSKKLTEKVQNQHVLPKMTPTIHRPQESLRQDTLIPMSE